MFLANFTRHPDHYARLLAGGICNELPEMLMISLFKLVLDYNTSISAQVSGENVNREVTYANLATDNLKIKAEHLSEEIYMLDKPGSEVDGFVFPDISKIDAYQLAELKRVHLFGFQTSSSQRPDYKPRPDSA